MEAILAAAGFAAGGLVAWILATARGRAELREAESRAAAAEASAQELRSRQEAVAQETERLRTDLSEARTARAVAESRLAEERMLLDEARAKLGDTFKALASDALQANRQEFLALADEKLKQGSKDLEHRQKAIEEVLSPVKKSLEDVAGKIQEMEVQRAGLDQQILSLQHVHEKLQSETGNLVKALRAPQVRGRWGEIQLKRVVEIAGMVDRCDFFEQETVATEDGRLRPDLRVQLPGKKNVVIDAKAPLAAYLEAVEAGTEEGRRDRLQAHARQIRGHMKELSKKSYWEQLKPTPEFVVLFLPGEPFFSAALEHDPTLIEDGAAEHVIFATPTTLIALLRAIHYGWRQENLAENAQRISELGQELYDRLVTMAGHFAGLGGAIDQTVRAYNETLGSLETRVLRAARRFPELAIEGKRGMEELKLIDRTIRAPRVIGEGEEAKGAPR